MLSLDRHDREIIIFAKTAQGIDGELVRDLRTGRLEISSKNLINCLMQFSGSDNNPGYTTYETVNYDECRGLDVQTTPRCSREPNGMAEALVKTINGDDVWLSDLALAERVSEQLDGCFEIAARTPYIKPYRWQR